MSNHHFVSTTNNSVLPIYTPVPSISSFYQPSLPVLPSTFKPDMLAIPPVSAPTTPVYAPTFLSCLPNFSSVPNTSSFSASTPAVTGAQVPRITGASICPTAFSGPSTPTFSTVYGQGKINQLGGMFVNGRPLPMPIRMRIVDMHAQGIKACDISRKLKVSHGAVSKILAKFVETGSIEPGQIGGNPRSRGTIQHVQLAVRQLYLQRPELLADEIHSLLVERKICSRKNLPTISTINKIIKTLRRQKTTERKDYKIDRFLCDEKSGDSHDEAEGSSKMAQKALKFMQKGDIIDGSERSEQDRSSTAVVEIKESKKNEKSEIQAYTEEYERSESSSPGVEVNKAEWSSCEKLQKKKRNRTTFTTFQLDSLEIFFAKNGYPGHDAIKKLSQSIQLNKQKIMTWLSNRRAKERNHFRQKIEQELRSSQHSFYMAMPPMQNFLPNEQVPLVPYYQQPINFMSTYSSTSTLCHSI